MFCAYWLLFYFFEGLLDFIVVRFSCWYVGAPNVTNYSVFVYYEDGSFGNCVAFEFCEIVAFDAVGSDCSVVIIAQDWKRQLVFFLELFVREGVVPAYSNDLGFQIN